VLLDNVPNVPEVVKDIFDKEERLDIIKEGQKLSKEELDLAIKDVLHEECNPVKPLVAVEGMGTLVEAELLDKEVGLTSAPGVGYFKGCSL
jgi:hypothetical protein